MLCRDNGLRGEAQLMAIGLRLLAANTQADDARRSRRLLPEGSTMPCMYATTIAYIAYHDGRKEATSRAQRGHCIQ